ncbi:unnamed protein product [Fraxinus pennsylvanica]|uniref:Peptidase M17 leucyl aminopeptidase N-terminal domain-containing protein n=1 Tax=Fraxinus pennsylvanica TaxID=56036 RepID=A0AAD2EA66_9LAMI|nr:unnamed protein product [Fraxinus pennsylvanica]
MLKLDSQLGGLLSKESSEEDFTGKTGQAIVLKLRGLGSKRIGLIGLGSTTSAIASYRNLGETLGLRLHERYQQGNADKRCYGGWDDSELTQLQHGLKDSGIGSQGITNSIDMMTKVKSTVINLSTPSYTMG